MKKAIFFSMILFMGVTQVFAQWNVEGRRDEKWYFGVDYNLNILDFKFATSTQLPNIDTTINQIMDARANYSMICDTAANLQFYSNGSIIYDNNFQPMQNGDSIAPNYYNTTLCFVDGVFILPMPKHDSLYYIFTVTNDIPCVILESQYIYYSIVNMKKNNGKGVVISKANLLFSSDEFTPGHLKACRHGNGRDWWLLIKDLEGNTFYRFLIDSSGIQTFQPQTIGSAYLFGGAFQAAFSPKGDKYANITSHGPFSNDTTTLNIYDFDRCTGLLSNPIQYPLFRVDTIAKWFSCCFSPSGEYLYWSNSDSIFQYNLQTNVSVNVAVFDTTLVDSTWASMGLTTQLSFGTMQLAPDGRIYIGTFMDYLHYIDKPDLAGMACDVHQSAIHLPKMGRQFYINMPFYSMPPLWGSACDSLGSVGVNNIALNKNKLLVYPNPSQGEFEIEVDMANVKIEVYNLLGVLVYQQSNCNKITTINLSEVANGLYFLRVMSDEKEYASQKLLKW